MIQFDIRMKFLGIKGYILKKWNLHGRHPFVQVPFMNRVDLAKLFAELEFKIGAEIGTLRGDYAEVLCQEIPNLTLFCVDPYREYKVSRLWHKQKDLDDAYKIAQDRLKNYKVKFIRDFSVPVAEKFKDDSLDFVYIDANHTFRNVVDDIDSWYKKVRPGGIISGHDFLRRFRPTDTHVIEAVSGYAYAYSIKPVFLTDRPAQLKGKGRDFSRSWFFVK